MRKEAARERERGGREGCALDEQLLNATGLLIKTERQSSFSHSIRTRPIHPHTVESQKSTTTCQTDTNSNETDST